MTEGRLGRTFRLAPILILEWAVAAWLASEVADLPAPEQAPILGTIGRSLVTGALIGTASAWLESGPLARMSRALPLWAALVTRTVVYAAVVAAVMVLLISGVAWVRYGTGPGALLRAPEYQALVSWGSLAGFFLLLLAASFVINFALQLRRVLGPETLKALFLGTYRRPRREERAFVFLDLKDSTAWAERLGPLAFTDFKNDFFADVAEPVLATGGRIVQYVGDEVMVSWPISRAEADAAPLRFFFLVEARIDRQADRYRTRYGDVPRFKAGAHGGEVVTAEVGDLKRDIVHSGDVVNTAARIEAECRPRGERLLVSQALLDRMPVLPEATVTRLGAAALRGKAEPVEIAAVARSEMASGVRIGEA